MPILRWRLPEHIVMARGRSDLLVRRGYHSLRILTYIIACMYILFDLWTPQIENKLLPSSNHPRTYPVQFGKNLLKAFENHIGTCPVRRDLRFKPQYNRRLTDLAQFELLGLGDCWEDADLLPVLTYLMTSSKCRWGNVECISFNKLWWVSKRHP